MQHRSKGVIDPEKRTPELDEMTATRELSISIVIGKPLPTSRVRPPPTAIRTHLAEAASAANIGNLVHALVRVRYQRNTEIGG
jgi:hypothetical protein